MANFNIFKKFLNHENLELYGIAQLLHTKYYIAPLLYKEYYIAQHIAYRILYCSTIV